MESKKNNYALIPYSNQEQQGIIVDNNNNRVRKHVSVHKDGSGRIKTQINILTFTDSDTARVLGEVLKEAKNSKERWQINVCVLAKHLPARTFRFIFSGLKKLFY